MSGSHSLATQSDGMRVETSVMVTVASAAARWKSARAPAATAERMLVEVSGDDAATVRC